MATRALEAPLIVIVGPTASGKTSLAIELAEKFGGEIICADSRTVYEGLDIGTAKPTKEEQARVPHWGLDLVEPNQTYTVADFQKYTVDKIEEIRARGKIPFLVGGSGLYIDAVVLDYEFSDQHDEARRKELGDMSIDELYKYCFKHNIKLPENTLNKRYVIRAIEQNGVNQKRRQAPIDNCIVVGITTDRGVLRQRMESRFEQMFADGVVEEARLLGKKYGWDSEAMTGNIYPLLHSFIEGELTLEDLQQKFTTLDWRLAKRQLTWFKRNTFITWLSLEDANIYLSQELARHTKS